jgi:LysM repeat protein
MKANYMKLTFALLIALAIVAGSLPRSARAAAKCTAYYTVQEGDTTPRISQTFGLKWREIADANDLERAWKPVPGTYLCIPAEESTTSGSSGSGLSTTSTVPSDNRASYSAEVAGRKVAISGSNFTKKQVFFVKVRDADQNVGGWLKVGTFRIPKSTTKTQTYQLPDALRDKLYIDVCLKNASTDELICRTVLHTY